MEFRDKRALVTGAAGGIGSSVVERLREAGANVAVADIDTDSIQAEARLPGDLLDAGYADGLAAAAHKALGGLDIVINNAGVITRGPITQTTDADWALSMGVNVEAPFRICRAAIPLMARAGGGAIVNVSSCWGRQGARSKSRALLRDQGGSCLAYAMYGHGPCWRGCAGERGLPERGEHADASHRLRGEGA